MMTIIECAQRKYPLSCGRYWCVYSSMRSKILGCAKPQVQVSHVLLCAKRKRNEPVGPDYILLNRKRPKSSVDSLSIALQDTSLNISNDRKEEEEEGAFMFVRGGIGAHNEQDQNLLSAKFCALPLSIREDEGGGEQTQKRHIGGTTTLPKRFVEAKRTRARVIPPTSNSDSTPTMTPHHVEYEEHQFCVIDVVNMGLPNNSDDKEVIPIEDTRGDELLNGTPQGDSKLQDDEQRTEDGREEWVYDIYRSSGTKSTDMQQLLNEPSSLGIVELEDVGYADDEGGELLESRNVLNLIMENDSEWSDLSDEDDEDSNDEGYYCNDYPDGKESDEEPLVVRAVDSETDEEWMSSDADDIHGEAYSPYGGVPLVHQAYWREVESSYDDEDDL